MTFENSADIQKTCTIEDKGVIYKTTNILQKINTFFGKTNNKKLHQVISRIINVHSQEMKYLSMFLEQKQLI